MRWLRSPNVTPDKRAADQGTADAAATTAAAPGESDRTATPPGRAPAAQRALRRQGRRTMRRLLDASMIAFASRGYHATRVNDIVEIAKTSHGTFYLYFSNKEDLLRALIDDARNDASALYGALRAVKGEPESREELRAWIAQFSALWRRYAPLTSAWTDMDPVDVEAAAEVRRLVEALIDALAQRIEAAGPPEGIEPRAAATAVIAMLDRFQALTDATDGQITPEALDTLTTIIHSGVFHPAAP